MKNYNITVKNDLVTISDKLFPEEGTVYLYNMEEVKELHKALSEIIESQNTQKPEHVCNWQKSWDGSTEICKCGAWR